MDYRLSGDGSSVGSTPSNPVNIAAKQWRSSILDHRVILVLMFALVLLLVVLGSALSPSPLVAVALVGAIAVAVGVMLRPSLSLFLVFAGAGLPTLLLPLPGHYVRPIEGALLVCLLVIVIRRPHLQVRLPHLLALLFIAIAVVSFIHVPEISTNVNDYGANKRLYELALVILALFCGTYLAGYVRDTSSLLVIVLLSNIPVYLIGFLQALGVHLPNLLEASGAQDPILSGGRLWGPFDGAVTFGMYLVNLFAIALVVWLLGTRRRDRIIGACVTAVTCFEIVGSGTRNATIAVGILLLVACILTRRFKFLAGIVVLAGFAGVVLFNKILPLLIHPDTSATNRIFLEAEAFSLIKANPVIGIGLAQFPKYYAQLIIPNSSTLNPHGISVHNQYLELAMESGIIWLIVGALLLFSITFVCWQAYRIAQREQRVLALAAMLATLATIVMGFLDVPLDNPEGAVLLFLLAGLALGYVANHRAGYPAQRFSNVGSIVWQSKVEAVRALGVGRGLFRQLPHGPQEQERVQSKGALSPPHVANAESTRPNIERTGRSIVLQMLSWGIAIPIVFPTTAVLTRYLGPTQYGEYSLTLPFLAILALLSGTGMDPLTIRQLSREVRTKWSDTLSYAIGTRLVSTMICISMTLLIVLVLPVGADRRNLFLLGSISLLFSFSFNGLRMAYTYGFRAEQRVSSLSLIETTDRLVTAGLIVFAVFWRLSLLWTYILIVYSDLPFFIVLVALAQRRYRTRIRFSFARAREHLLASLPLMGYNLLTIITEQADLFLITALTNSQSVGIYALAMRITDPLLALIFAFVNGIFPLLCTKFDEGREQFSEIYWQATRVVALGIIPLSVFVSAEASTLVQLLGGQQFTAAAVPLQLLIWSMAVTFFNQLAVRSCMAANLERKIPYVTAVSLTVNLLANFVLIPIWQATGAGLASLISSLTGFCLFSILLRGRVRLLPTFGLLLRVCLACLPVLIFLVWQSGASLLLTAPIALVFAITACLLLRVLSTNDVRMARQFLLSRRKGKQHKDVESPPRVENRLPRDRDITDWPTVILPSIQI